MKLRVEDLNDNEKPLYKVLAQLSSQSRSNMTLEELQGIADGFMKVPEDSLPRKFRTWLNESLQNYVWLCEFSQSVESASESWLSHNISGSDPGS